MAAILHLRRALRGADESVRQDVEAALSYLEEQAGPTVSRAEAARLLGVSYPVLDRWIKKGDIAAVLTPSGRREIPLTELVDLVERLEKESQDPLALARVIRRRRQEAADISEEEFLSPRRRRPRTHRAPELHALAYHRLVARRLDPDLVNEARRRLKRWERTGKIDDRWAAEWRRILAMPASRIAKAITADTERGRGLRQTSPFAGVLTEHERRRVAQAVEQRVAG
jgi:excisionase family DNA binding protein